MTAFTEILRQRLARLGMHFEGEVLHRAEAIVDAHSERPESLHDIQLMSIAVEAYRKPESPELV